MKESTKGNPLSCKDEETLDNRKSEGRDDNASLSKQHFQSLTIHGLSRIFSSTNKAERYFWASLFFMALLVAIIMISVSIKKLLSKRIYVCVHKEARNTVPFPVITFCSSPYTLDEFSEVYNKKQNYDVIMEPGLDLLLPNVTGSCFFSSYNKCNYTNDFSFLPGNKACISFNLKQTYKQMVMGRDFGLKLILFSRPQQPKIVYSGDGIHIMIHRANTFPVTVGEGISVAPGMETMISIREKYFHRLPSPFASNCTGKNTKSHNIFPGDYTSIGCYSSCFYQKFYEHCGFVPSSFKFIAPFGKFEEKGPISKLQKQNCGKHFYSKVLQHGGLKCDCPVPCKETIFNFQTSVLSWKPLTKEIRAVLAKKLNIPGKNVTEQIASETLARVRIYFKSLDLEVYNENEVYDAGSLFSDFGGQMGLMLGASLISLVELMAPILIAMYSRIISLLKSRKLELRNTSYHTTRESVSVIENCSTHEVANEIENSNSNTEAKI